MMRRKYVQPALPNLYFKDGVLSVPGYTFNAPVQWADTGSMTLLAEGSSLKDESPVLAKIAPAHTNGSMCLEREAHILGRLSVAPEAAGTSLRLIDFYSLSKDKGDCVVILLSHPGSNTLGRCFPPSRVNSLLLAEASRPRPTSSHGDIYMLGVEETESMDEDSCDVMDLATFLEFAIQATHCLEVLHKQGLIHREVRANAFHLNAHSNLCRFAHYGNRAISLETFGGPSTLVIRAADGVEEVEKLKVKEALCYLAPEQTGGVETNFEDHRTDLYSLGILFWTLIVGRGRVPFEGGPLELLHSIVQKRPMPVHEVRRDVPQVLALIVDKLLSKSPDHRYQSAHGLKADLLECQRRLQVSVSSQTDQSYELIPPFEIASQDRYADFTIPTALFGREKELDVIRNVIRSVSTSFARHVGATKGYITISSSSTSHDTGTMTGNLEEPEREGSVSSKSEGSTHDCSPKIPPTRMSTSPVGEPSVNLSNGAAATPMGMSMSSPAPSNDSLRKAVLNSSSKPRSAKPHAVIISGPPGIGKSSLVIANQAKWRAHGLWGQAKFEDAESAPFAAMFSCLSSVLRQLMVFPTDLHRFVTNLKSRLGPQLQNLPLLYEGADELRDVLRLFDITIESPIETLSTRELRARFQSLVENVFSVLTETRLFALFLDDIHEADESSLDLIATLMNSKCRMLIFITIRNDLQYGEKVEKVRAMTTNRSRTVWMGLEVLPFSAIASMVSRTLRRSKEDCSSLARLIHAASAGNVFSARNVLMMLHRQGRIIFDWDRNHWQFDLERIQAEFLDENMITDPSDPTFLLQHLRELPTDARKFIIWASFFGATFKVTEVALLMDWEEGSSGSSGSGSEEDSEADTAALTRAASNIRETSLSTAHGSIRGLQIAIQEGWLIQRGRDMCSFAHDRYRQAAQAEVDNSAPDAKQKMSFRIVLMMLHDTSPDVYRISEHAKKCLDLLRDHPKREELLNLMVESGEAAWARGAHEVALQSLVSARSLLAPDAWQKDPVRTLLLFSRLAALYNWKGDYNESDVLVEQCLSKTDTPEDKAKLLRLRSRNHWMRNDYKGALKDNLLALHILGVEVNASPTRREADAMFEQVKNEILAVGFDDILAIPRARDIRTDLAAGLLNDAGIHAYWSDGEGFADVIGLTTIQLALRSGMSPGTALGFFWTLGAAADRRGLYRLSADLGKLALRIAEKYGGSFERCRAQVLYCAMVSGYDNVHIRNNIPLLQQAIMFGNSAGDRVYTSFAHLNTTITRLFICDHLGELVSSAEESLNDIKMWTPGSDAIVLQVAVVNCIRALAGHTYAATADTIFDTEDFQESEYMSQLHLNVGNLTLTLNWYNAFKMVALFCLGFVEDAAELGFYVYETRDSHPNHRFTRYALFFHSLALIACIREGIGRSDWRERYARQVENNQSYLRKWVSPSPINTSTWVALVDAEWASVHNRPDAFKLYDVAVKLAVNNDWLMEEGWALFLEGSHLIRCGVEGLGSELQSRGISRHAQWGAHGIVQNLSSASAARSRPPLKRHIFSTEVGVQTDGVVLGIASPSSSSLENSTSETAEEDETSGLSAADLASILRWSKDISNDLNISAALQRLTEIVTEYSGAQSTCVVMLNESGDYTVHTTMVPPGACHVYDTPKPIRTISDPLQKALVQHSLNTKERVYYEDAAADPRFAAEADQSAYRSIICLPIFSNRGQTFGTVYLASKYAFSRNTFNILSLLCQQANISVSNAVLFRSVQAGTKENLRMITIQKSALDIARKNREEAEKATKIKSNFLASMSHELRTPFSSFYGLLDLLSGTELNAGQREIVQTAKQSCELLLKIIDSILDYSKLEASAVKLEYSGFLVEDIIADCMELLLPMAVKKLDLSFNIEPDVPAWVEADYARIRQVLMNLIGNAVKFTASGSVRVICARDKTGPLSSGAVQLKFTIQDTGIGLSPADKELLFVPFQQADNSSTRRFGGTGLGLSISRQLMELMRGQIGVESELGIGSTFWFTIPVKIFESEDSKQASAQLEHIKSQLVEPRPLEILISSPSDATRALLSNILDGFSLASVASFEDTELFLRASALRQTPLDFIILDDQSETHADDLARAIHSVEYSSLQDTKIIHLYTPTTDSLTGHTIFTVDAPGIVRMTKPPRKARLLQTIASLKNLPDSLPLNKAASIGTSRDEPSLEARTLYGNVLIAEDNPVAQQLLVKQLERYNLNVVPTSNGELAISEWEAHEPGYFSVALFDHHMPICDGVEAAKRIRMLEGRRKLPVSLPIVALSADCQESTKQLCLSAGMNAFLSKPLKRNDLLSLLSMNLESSS